MTTKEHLHETLDICLVLTVIVGTVWFLYKFFAGAYHLLDKLIDKL